MSTTKHHQKDDDLAVNTRLLIVENDATVRRVPAPLLKAQNYVAVAPSRTMRTSPIRFSRGSRSTEARSSRCATSETANTFSRSMVSICAVVAPMVSFAALVTAHSEAHSVPLFDRAGTLRREVF